jgi:flagellar motor switch/type III secretory pathway protein FliN
MESERITSLLGNRESPNSLPSLSMASRLLREAKPVEWEEFDEDAKIMRVDRPVRLEAKSVELRIELGRTCVGREEALHLRSGTLLPLDNAVSEPVAVYADGQLFAWGEVVDVEGRIGVRVLELVSSSDRAQG